MLDGGLSEFELAKGTCCSQRTSPPQLVTAASGHGPRCRNFHRPSGYPSIAAVLMHRNERGEAAERLTAPGYCYTGCTCSITRTIAFFSSRKSCSSYLYKL